MQKSDMKVYIAAPFFNEEQLSVVKRIESYLRENGINFFSPRSEGTLVKMSPEERKAKMSELFQSNVNHMDWCTHCIAVIDDYDTGTVWEMGYLFATGKKIVSFSANYHGINVMLNESIQAHCVDYGTLLAGLEGNFTGQKTSDVE